LNQRPPKVYEVDLNTEPDEDPIEFEDNRRDEFQENNQEDDIESLSELNEESNPSESGDSSVQVVREERSYDAEGIKTSSFKDQDKDNASLRNPNAE